MLYFYNIKTMLEESQLQFPTTAAEDAAIKQKGRVSVGRKEGQFLGEEIPEYDS
jgi:hypothetical protein